MYTAEPKRAPDGKKVKTVSGQQKQQADTSSKYRRPVHRANYPVSQGNNIKRVPSKKKIPSKASLGRSKSRKSSDNDNHNKSGQNMRQRRSSQKSKSPDYCINVNSDNRLNRTGSHDYFVRVEGTSSRKLTPSGQRQQITSSKSSFSNLPQPCFLSQDNQIANTQQLQMSAFTHESLNIFGKQAIVSTTQSQVNEHNRFLNRTNSGQYLNLVSPVNSDLAGLPGTEDLVVNMVIQQPQAFQTQTQRQHLPPQNVMITETKDPVRPSSRGSKNHPIKQKREKEMNTMPSTHQMSTGILKLKKNIQQKKLNNSASNSLLPALPENTNIVKQVIQQRQPPPDQQIIDPKKDDYKIVAQIIHLALQRRSKNSQTQQQNSRGYASSEMKSFHSIKPGSVSTNHQKNSNQIRQNIKNRPSSSTQCDHPNRVVTFGHKSSGRKSSMTNHHNETEKKNSLTMHFRSMDESINEVVLPNTNNHSTSLNITDKQSESQSVLKTQKSSHDLKKEIDLRAEEVLDAYFLVMRDLKPDADLFSEYIVFNVLAKISLILVQQNGFTWAQALESIIQKKVFKENSQRIIQNFIFRKFFCKWLYCLFKQRYEANKFLQQQQQMQMVHLNEITAKQQQNINYQNQIYSEESKNESSEARFQATDEFSHRQRPFMNEEGESSFKQNLMIGSTFGIQSDTRESRQPGTYISSSNQSGQQSLMQAYGHPVKVMSGRDAESQHSNNYGRNVNENISQINTYSHNETHDNPMSDMCNVTYENIISPQSEQIPVYFKVDQQPQQLQPHSFGNTMVAEVSQHLHQKNQSQHTQPQIYATVVDPEHQNQSQFHNQNLQHPQISQRTLQQPQRSASMATTEDVHKIARQPSLTKLVQQFQGEREQEGANLQKIMEHITISNKRNPNQNMQTCQIQHEMPPHPSKLLKQNIYKRENVSNTQKNQTPSPTLEEEQFKRAEKIKKGLRRAKRTIQRVRHRLSQGFLRFTYTDEWLSEALYRWRQYIYQQQVNIHTEEEACYISDHQILDEEPTKWTTDQIKNSIEDEEHTEACMDKMLEAIQHRQNSLKSKSFAGFVLHTQRINIMTKMSIQMQVHSQIKYAHKILLFWHARLKKRQQRKNRAAISRCYYENRVLTYTFAAWVQIQREKFTKHQEMIQASQTAFRISRYLAQELQDFQRQQEHQQEDAGRSISNMLLIGHVFNALKERTQCMIAFKAKVAERMIRQTLLGLKKVAQRQRYIKKTLKKHYRAKTRSFARNILTYWSNQAKREKELKFPILMLSVKRGGRLKKLIWKVLRKNARARQADRQETRFATLFFYQLVIKRCLKAFKLNFVQNTRARKKIAFIKANLLHKKRMRIFKAFKITGKKLNLLDEGLSFFAPEVRRTRWQRFWLNILIQTANDNRTVANFQRMKLLQNSFARLKDGIAARRWERELVTEKRTVLSLKEKAKVVSILADHRDKSQRLTSLYSQLFITCNKRQKSLILNALHSYSRRKSTNVRKCSQLILKFRRGAKQRLLLALKEYAVNHVKKSLVTERVRLKIKQKVWSQMLNFSSKRVQINQIYSQVMMDHYQRLCCGLLREWRDLSINRLERRDSLLKRQQSFQVRRFYRKLRSFTEIRQVKRHVNANLQTFNEKRLLAKSLLSFKEYLASEQCALRKMASKLREQQLRNRTIQAFNIVVSRNKKQRFFQKRREANEKSKMFQDWVGSLDNVFKYRSIFIDVDIIKKQRLFRALKAHWVHSQIRKAQFEQCRLLRHHFLKEKAMGAWMSFCIRSEEKRQLDDRKGNLADNIYLATLMHHWFQVSRKKASLRAIRHLVERKHRKAELSRKMRFWRVELHKMCFVEQVNCKRQVLKIQEIFHVLRENKNARRSRRELNKARIDILMLQRKRKVFQSLKMQHFLSMIAKPPLLKQNNRYGDVSQTPALEQRRQSRSRSRSQSRGCGVQGPLTLSSLSQKAPQTPINKFMYNSMRSPGSAAGRYRYAAEGAAAEYNFNSPGKH